MRFQLNQLALFIVKIGLKKERSLYFYKRKCMSESQI
jgi:hypothetical protein